jgi:hypothetical protein
LSVVERRDDREVRVDEGLLEGERDAVALEDGVEDLSTRV